MHKKLLVTGIVITAICLPACQNSRSNMELTEPGSAAISIAAVETDQSLETSQNVRTYKLKTDKDGIPLPVITLNTDDQTFTFSYDMLSSYIAVGTYKQEDGLLTLETEDGAYHYIFDIEDENTLKFNGKRSSEIRLTDHRIGVPIEDGAEFTDE